MIVKNFNYDSEWQKAKEKGKEMVRNGLYNRFDEDEQQRVINASIGYLGELAFQQFLLNNNIEYELDEGGFENRNTDEFDIRINGRLIDIKVAKKSTKNNPNDNWTYGYPEDQHPENKDYVVIGWVDSNCKQVGFYGWIEGEEISRFEVREKNSYKGYRYLTPNHEFAWGSLNKDFNQLFTELNII